MASAWPPSGREVPSGAGEDRGCWYRFTQQRLSAWQPLFSVPMVVSGFMATGALFIAIGIALLAISDGVVEYEHDYTDAVTGAGGVGHFDITVDREMEPPIWIYYQLDGFHQNHRKYVKSRDDAQFSKSESPQFAESELRASCEPWVAASDGRLHYPCGLVARSVFNDTFVVLRNDDPPSETWSRLAIDSSAKAIAWPSDTEGRFRNVNPEGRVGGDSEDENQLRLNMWTLNLFPPVTCEQQTFVGGDYEPVEVATKEVNGINVTDCRDYVTAPQCNFKKDGAPFVCQGDYTPTKQPEWGIESGHFLVWMRIAGLPRFRKLWGKVDQVLPKDTTLRVHFHDNFEVIQFSGRKAFVISTSTVLGGRSDFLGIGYLAVGGCCLLFGLGFAWRHSLRGRQLGDVSLLHQTR